MTIRGSSDNGTRQAAALFVLAAGLGLINSFIPGAVGYDNDALRVVDCGGLVVAAAARWLPWHRWHPRATLTLVAGATFLIGASNVVGGVPPTLYGVWFIVIFAWVGMWHPPGTGLRIAPLLAVGFVVPFAFQADAPAGAMSSVAIVVPAGAILGEALARTHEAMRQARAAQEEATALLAKASVTDDLTGIGNRRHANRLLDELRIGDAVILIDLDHFKDVNDAHGHIAGDELLVELADHLRTSVADPDDLARYGGEEFLVVVRAAEAGGHALAERLLDGWCRRAPRATFSAGVAVHAAGVAPTETLQRADRALYEAKHAGRNRVLTAASA